MTAAEAMALREEVAQVRDVIESGDIDRLYYFKNLDAKAFFAKLESAIEHIIDMETPHEQSALHHEHREAIEGGLKAS